MTDTPVELDEARKGRLWVSEVFGPTVQGEGPSCGRIAGFLRLAGCNLECAWCDTPYTWDWAGKNGPPADRADTTHQRWPDLADRLLAMDTPLVVITGGEPLLQQRHLLPLLSALVEAGRRVEFETNGTRAPKPELEAFQPWYNVSPKLANAGMRDVRTIDMGVLEAFQATGRATYKFVCQDEGDVDTVALLTGRAGIKAEQVWIMPEGRTRTAVEHVSRNLADAAIAYRFNITTRLHVALWGDRRGR